MKPLIVTMLAIQAAILLVTIYAVCVRKPTPAKPQPIWSSFAISLIVIAGVSVQMAERHHDRGSDFLRYGAVFLLGMGVLAMLLALRKRRGFETG